MTLKAGDKAPDFTLPSDSQNQAVTLSSLIGKKVILYFYPKDNTPGCTKESCDFRDHFFDDGLAKRAEVFGFEHKTAGAPYHVIPVVFRQPAGRVCVFGIPGQGRPGRAPKSDA